MGAEFQTLTVKSTDKKQIEKQFKAAQDEDRYENGHSYSGGLGMAPGLEFPRVPTFENEGDADQWLADNAVKWENALGVFFKTKSGETACLIGAWCSC